VTWFWGFAGGQPRGEITSWGARTWRGDPMLFSVGARRANSAAIRLLCWTNPTADNRGAGLATRIWVKHLDAVIETRFRLLHCRPIASLPRLGTRKVDRAWGAFWTNRARNYCPRIQASPAQTDLMKSIRPLGDRRVHVLRPPTQGPRVFRARVDGQPSSTDLPRGSMPS